MRKIALYCMALVLFAASGSAQVSTGKILGSVQDTSGGVLPDVAIKVISLDTGAVRQLLSNDRG